VVEQFNCSVRLPLPGSPGFESGGYYSLMTSQARNRAINVLLQLTRRRIGRGVCGRNERVLVK
jgi:hypothetical protein